MLVNGMVVEPSDCGFTTVVKQRRLLTPAPAQAQRRPTQALMPVGVAHNAAFDAPRIEQRLPTTAGRAWACSCHEVS